MERKITPFIFSDLQKKMVFITGPRQVGKTTLSKALYPESFEYLNYDRSEHRLQIFKKRWNRDVDLVVFDELHKHKKWKSWIKGIYDTEGISPRILVTGSARLDTFKKGGDSLAGRYYTHRLHPFSVAELANPSSPKQCQETMELLLTLGGFPEPFLSGSEEEAKRWRQTHAEKVLAEDVRDLQNIKELKTLELLIELLAERAGSTISYSSLARDLEVSPHTIKRWVALLEALYIIFLVPPFSKNIARSILKEPKIYFYDTGRLPNNPGARFENLVACALLKRNHFLEDTKGQQRFLYYVKDKEQREVDFLSVVDKRIEWLVEAKSSETQPSDSLKYFSERLSKSVSYSIQPIQVVKTLQRAFSTQKITVQPAHLWLAGLEA